MAIYSFEISNSRDVKKNEVKASEHHDYISRLGKYSPEINLENNSYSATSHLEYVQRQNAFSKKEEYEDLVVAKNKNMPEWAEKNPNVFWLSSEMYERVNGRTYSEFLLALPFEFSNAENEKLVDKFCEDTFGESFVYSYGIHSKDSSEVNIQNVHAHIMFCERKLDGIERSPEKFFKRYNPKFPERGGAMKDRFWNDIKMFSIMRKSWEKHLNEALEQKGIERVSCESLEIQKIEAKLAGDILKEEFLNRPPVNCKGKILMKINKYGEDSLSKKEKEEYELYLIAKELRKTYLEEYNQKLEKENKKSISLDSRDIILDRAKFSVYESKKNFENINEFNNYELQKYKANFSLLGLDVLANETSIGARKQIEREVISNFNFSNFNFKNEKKYQDNFSSLKHENYNFLLEDLDTIKDNQIVLLKNENKLKEDKKELVFNYKKEFMKTDIYYSLNSILNIKKNISNKRDIQVTEMFVEKYKEYKNIELDSENSRKVEIENWLEKSLYTLAEHYPSLYKVFVNEKIKLIELDKNNNDPQYLIAKESFEKFNEAYKKIETELEVFNTAINYSNEVLNQLEILKENKLKEEEWKKKEEKLNESKYNLNSETEIFIKNNSGSSNIISYKEKIKKYLEDNLLYKATDEKIKEYNKILNDSEKLTEIALKRKISVEKIILGYKKSVRNLEKELLDLNNSKKENDKIIALEKNSHKLNENEKIYTELANEIIKEKKSLYGKLDSISEFKDKFPVLNKLRNLTRKKEFLDSFFNEFTKVIDDSSNFKNKDTTNNKTTFKDVETNMKEDIKNKVEENSNDSIDIIKRNPLVRSANYKEDLNKAKGKKIKDSLIRKKNKDWEDYIKDNDNDIY